MAWGPELTFFCNDAYRRDTLGAKYPWALGKPASVVWSEIWDDVGPRIDSVMNTGVATWDEQLMLFLERSGYTEETYHTFSYSPLADDHGGVAGMLCVVSEDTEEVIARRRMQTLRDLGLRTAGSTTVADTVAAACSELADSSLDLPFALVYRYDDDRRAARLIGSTGFTSAHPAAPALLGSSHGPWPWPAAPTVVEVDLTGGFADLPTGAWDQPPSHAAVVPISQGTQPSYGFLATGLNPFRPLDTGYTDFLGLVAGHLASGITGALAFEFEQRRAETLAELDQAKTDFFTNVSHEFRTPLTAAGRGPLQPAPGGENAAPRRHGRPLHRRPGRAPRRGPRRRHRGPAGPVGAADRKTTSRSWWRGQHAPAQAADWGRPQPAARTCRAASQVSKRPAAVPR